MKTTKDGMQIIEETITLGIDDLYVPTEEEIAIAKEKLNGSVEVDYEFYSSGRYDQSHAKEEAMRNK